MPKLSKRAQSLWDRLQVSGNWYLWEKFRNSPFMAELVEAGLVVEQMRVARVVRCFVPKGTIPYELESFPALPHDHPVMRKVRGEQR